MWCIICAALTLLCSLPKGKVHQVQADWLPLSSIEVLHIGQGHPLGLLLDVLVGWIIQEKNTPLKALGCRGCSVPLVSEDLVLDHWSIKRFADLLGQLLYISQSCYGRQLLPPVGCIQLVGLPFQLQLIVFY